MIEIERKYRLLEDTVTQVESLLDAQFKFETEVDQTDSIFLIGKSSFKDFKRGEPVARIRTVDGKSVLTVKRALNKDGDAEEYETEVSSAESARNILTALGGVLVTEVSKHRKTFSASDRALLLLDNVKHLGMFLEIEVMSDEERSDNNPEGLISRLAESLGLSSDDIEPRKYDELISALD